MNLDPETIVALSGGGGVIAMLGTMVTSLLRTNNGLHKQVREGNEALKEERESCTERIGKIETRLDAEREDCERRHQRMADRLDKMEDRLRRITPPNFPKVTP